MKKFKVTRFCCRSGMCMECKAVGNLKNRKRVVHADNLDKSKAEHMLHGWSDPVWGTKIEPMDDVKKEVDSTVVS